MHGQTCIFWANLTPFSLQVVRDHGRAKDRDGRWKALLVRGADRYRNFGENPPPELSTAGPVF